MKSMITKIQVLSLALLLGASVAHANEDVLTNTATSVGDVLTSAKEKISDSASSVAEKITEVTEKITEKAAPQSKIGAAYARMKNKAACVLNMTCENAQKAKLWVMDNKGKTVLIVGTAAVIAYIAWTYYQAQKEKEEDFARCRIC